MLTNNKSLSYIKNKIYVYATKIATIVNKNNIDNSSMHGYYFNNFLKKTLISYNKGTSFLSPSTLITNKKLLRMFSNLLIVRNRIRYPLYTNRSFKRFASKNVDFKKMH